MTDHNDRKETLTELLTTLTEELKGLGIHEPDSGDWVATPEDVATSEADPNVGADRVEDWDERNATLTELETRYRNLKRALEKIENGTYGVCEVSGEAIEADRLDANPAARTCKAHLDQESELPI